MAKNNDWKDRLNVVYSTNPEFKYEEIEDEDTTSTIKKNQQKLRVCLDRRQRGGKVVTLVTGYIGLDEDLKELGKLLKSKCGSGGAVKEGEVIVQGDFKQRVIDLLVNEGYTNTKGKG